MTVKEPIIFLTGSLIGAAAGIFAGKMIFEKKAETKYEALYQKEVASVKEQFAHLAERDKEKAEAAKEKPPLQAYTDALNKVRQQEAEREKARINYSNFSAEENEDLDSYTEDAPDYDTTLVEEGTDTSEPYLLKRMPLDSEEPGYTKIEVTYYSDGSYANTRDEEMEIEDYIGRKMMDYVENTDKDEIFIRNDELELDIDIIKDSRTYDEVMFG